MPRATGTTTIRRNSGERKEIGRIEGGRCGEKHQKTSNLADGNLKVAGFQPNFFDGPRRGPERPGEIKFFNGAGRAARAMAVLRRFLRQARPLMSNFGPARPPSFHCSFTVPE
jgi:hypothetical protein